MKTAFKILPDSSSEPLQLLIEVGHEGVAFVYYHGSPLHIAGIFIYQYNEPEITASFADDLKLFLQNEALPAFEGCCVCYNLKESSLIPNCYFKEDQKTNILDMLFGYNPNSQSFVQAVKGMQAKLVYRIPSDIHTVLNQTFINAKYFHSTALQLSFLGNESDLLYAIIFQQQVKLFLFKNNQIQIQQSFSYSTPSDVAYFFLNICEQHHIAADSIHVKLAGFIDHQSNLYNELYRYFIHIGIDDPNVAVSVATAIDQYPPHFFSHYFQLVACVS